MTNLSTLARVTFELDQEQCKKNRGLPYDEATMLVCQIYLRNFAPKKAHDFVTLSQPAETD